MTDKEQDASSENKFVCTLWIHDENTVKTDVVFNADRFPNGVLSEGKLARMAALDQNIAIRDFQKSSTRLTAKDGPKVASADFAAPSTPVNSLEDGAAADPILKNQGYESGSYIFVARELPTDIKSKQPGLQVSHNAVVVPFSTV